MHPKFKSRMEYLEYSSISDSLLKSAFHDFSHLVRIGTESVFPENKNCCFFPPPSAAAAQSVQVSVATRNKRNFKKREKEIKC